MLSLNRKATWGMTNAWPLMASLRAGFVKPLRREIGSSQDAWTQLAFVTRQNGATLT